MKIIECPRDAMQGVRAFIPTDIKIKYINQLLKTGFDTIDFGSFVSPKVIPQMRDTEQVLTGLNLSDTQSKLLAIVANTKGAHKASEFEKIDFLGYPLSLSETFQQRNTNRSINDAFDDLTEIQELCEQRNQILVVYLSMSFGNPYGDPYEIDFVGDFVEKLDELQVSVVSLSDTIGVANSRSIMALFKTIIPKFPHIEFGAHLHTTPATTEEKVKAVYESGCQRIDGAIKGFGGCPMAKDELIGNTATEKIIEFMESIHVNTGIQKAALNQSLEMAASEVFS